MAGLYLGQIMPPSTRECRKCLSRRNPERSQHKVPLCPWRLIECLPLSQCLPVLRSQVRSMQFLHAKCYRIWQNDAVIEFPNPTGSHSSRLSSIKDLNNMFPVLWKLLQPSIKTAFLPSVHDLTLFSSWRLCLEMKFLFKCILRAARHMSLRNRTQNPKQEMVNYLSDDITKTWSHQGIWMGTLDGI